MLDLSRLPPDIYAVILSFVPPLDRQKAVLNLSRAVPRSPVPTHQIYEHIILHTPRAVLYIYQLFRKRKAEQAELYNPSEQVRSLSVRTWVPDADLVVNLFALLPSVPVIQLFVGTTYSPEHLSDVFRQPRSSLRVLQLRFKPYVERATYMPFLKVSSNSFSQIFDSDASAPGCLFRFDHRTTYQMASDRREPFERLVYYARHHLLQSTHQICPAARTSHLKPDGSERRAKKSNKKVPASAHRRFFRLKFYRIWRCLLSGGTSSRFGFQSQPSRSLGTFALSLVRFLELNFWTFRLRRSRHQAPNAPSRRFLGS